MQTIGNKIKEIRKKLGITQEALSYNICSQSEISRIESNKIIPSTYLLQRIAEKLGVRVDYFYENTHGRNDYVNDIKELLEKNRRIRNYQEIHRIIRYESKSPSVFNDSYMKKYIEWHRGIVTYHLFISPQEAIDILLGCIKINENSYTELDVQILNSIGIIYRNERELEQASIYLKKALNLIQEFPYSNQDRITLKVMYSLSKVYTDMKDITASINLCHSGIKRCKNNEDLFLYAEFHYQLGRNLLFLGNENGIEYWEKALDILKIDDKLEFTNIINREIYEYKRNKILI